MKVKVQVLDLLPPLEQAPDQIASRPLLTLNVIELLVAKLADAVLPTATLMPAGLESTRSPLRPVAVTVNVAFAVGGFTVSVALRLIPPKEPVMMTAVEAVTEAVVTVKLALVAPTGTVTLAATIATALLLLESVTTAPPDGAALVRVTVPCDVPPPVTLVGLSVNVLRLAGGGTGVTVSVVVRLAPP